MYNRVIPEAKTAINPGFAVPFKFSGASVKRNKPTTRNAIDEVPIIMIAVASMQRSCFILAMCDK
jgi:hypothetical protein